MLNDSRILRHAILCASVTGLALYSQTGVLPKQKSVTPLVADVQVTITSPHGAHTSTGHYYRSRDGKVREDLSSGSVIADGNAGTVTILNPAKKEATVITGGATRAQSAQAAAPSTSVPSGSLAPAGQTTLEGHPVAKSINAGQTREVWTATDLSLQVFVKITAPNRTTTKAMRNIKVGDPDPAVFKIPAGYTVTTKAGPLAAPGPQPPPAKPPKR
jgi:hypothetical protein